MKWALLFALVFALFPMQAFAQTAVPRAVSPAPAQLQTPDPTKLDTRERALVKTAVADVRDSYRRSRTGAGVGNLVGGALVGGLGMYLYLSQDDPTLRLIGIAISFSAVPQLVSGVWNLFYNTSQEDMAAKLLADDRLIDGGGLLFVEQEARRAKRARLVGGSTSIVAGGATLATYFLLKEFYLAGPDNILLIFFAAGTAIQIIQGVITLVGKSGPERAYSRLVTDLGRDPLAPSDENSNTISKLRLSPALYGNEGKLAPGFGLSLGF